MNKDNQYDEVQHLQPICQLFGSFLKSSFWKDQKQFVKRVFDDEGLVWVEGRKEEPHVFWDGCWAKLKEGKADGENLFQDAGEYGEDRDEEKEECWGIVAGAVVEGRGAEDTFE